MKNLRLLSRMSALWAIWPGAVDLAISELLSGGEIASASGWEASKPSSLGKGSNRVAVIPIEGVLTKDGPAWYGSNYDAIAKAVDTAAADPEVSRIALVVDSPGGEVTGLPETAAVIKAARAVKPVSAMVTGMAASAAYYLASQATDISVTPSGEVGSVGVRMMHVDVSAALANEGVKVTELYSGDHKTEWSPYAPLSDDAKADMMPRLQASHQGFIDAVADGRGNRVTQEITAARFGEGRTFDASVALTHGLIDRVQSQRDFFKLITPAAETAVAVPQFPIHRALASLRMARRRVNG